MVEWLERCDYDPQGLGSKPTRAILLCPWERQFMALFPACWSASSFKFRSYLLKIEKPK